MPEETALGPIGGTGNWPNDHGLADLARSLDAGLVRSVDLVAACLRRIEARESEIRAFSRLRSDDVIREAAAADAELQSGRRRSPVHGIPFSVKETLTSEWGADDSRQSILLQRLASSGGIMVGLTRATELAARRTAAPDGLVVNPIDSEVAVGGSSAGSAAAVAAGFCHFSVATDTGGSVRAPAAYCGVVGFKPTSGAVPLDAGLILSPRLDHVGLLARSAADCLVCLPVLVGTKIPANHRATLTGVTFGLDEAVVSPEMVRFVEALVGRAKTRGGRLVAVRLPRSSDIVAEYRAALDGSAPPGKRLQGLRQAYAALFDLVDVVVSTPVPVPMPTRPQYDADRAGPEFYTRRAASILLNIVGAPGIVLPVRLQRGGLGSVQLSAAPGADFYLLNVAGALE